MMLITIRQLKRALTKANNEAKVYGDSAAYWDLRYTIQRIIKDAEKKEKLINVHR